MQQFSHPLISRCLLLGAAAVLAAPVVLGLGTIDPAKRARALNRPLAEMPKAQSILTDPIGAVGQVADHLADRSLGLLTSARWMAAFRYEVLGDAGARTTVRQGDFTFVADHDLYGERGFRAIHASCADANAEGLRSQITERGARLAAAAGAPERPVGFLVVPSKPVLYADRLPAAVPAELRKACAAARADTGWAKTWAADAERHGYRALYPLAAFEEERETPHFYPPENFHSHGAAGHLAAWSMLDRLYPGDYPPGGPGFRTVTGKADMRSVYLYDRRITILRPRYGKIRATRDSAAEQEIGERFPGIREFRVWRRETPTLRRRAVAIGNSFSLHVAPHIAVGFDELILVFTNRLSVDGARAIFLELIPEEAPDAVIFIHHEAAHKGRGLDVLDAATRED